MFLILDLWRLPDHQHTYPGTYSLHSQTLILLLSSSAWYTEWHPDECSITRWITTLLDIILEHPQHCCNSKLEG